MQRRVVTSFKELYDNSKPVYEEIKIKKLPKGLKGYVDVDRGKGKYIKGDPESKGKSEAQIEKEIVAYLKTIPDCADWDTKVKGELQSIGIGQAIIKESKNKGFGDRLICLRGLFVMIEVKACGRYQSIYQIEQEEKVKKRGLGHYFLVTSVRELKAFFTQYELI